MPDQTNPAPSDPTESGQTMPDQNRGDPRFKAQPTPATDQTAGQPPASDDTPVSDDRVQPDGSGQHGRPTDDSDPGHS